MIVFGMFKSIFLSFFFPSNCCVSFSLIHIHTHTRSFLFINYTLNTKLPPIWISVLSTIFPLTIFLFPFLRYDESTQSKIEKRRRRGEKKKNNITKDREKMNKKYSDPNSKYAWPQIEFCVELLEVLVAGCWYSCSFWSREEEKIYKIKWIHHVTLELMSSVHLCIFLCFVQMNWFWKLCLWVPHFLHQF